MIAHIKMRILNLQNQGIEWLVSKRRLHQVIRRSIASVFLHRERLQPDRILAAYRRGYYLEIKWGMLYWRNPKKRVIIPFDELFHVERTLRKKIKQHIFEVTLDKAFPEVIKACATMPGRYPTWISPEIIKSFIRLHELGHAHSVEVWHDGRLVGGQYGLAIGGFFSGESMFHLEDNASRVGMVYLVEHLKERGFILHDTHQMGRMARSFGAVEVESVEYHAMLEAALSSNVRF